MLFKFVMRTAIVYYTDYVTTKTSSYDCIVIELPREVFVYIYIQILEFVLVTSALSLQVSNNRNSVLVYR